MIKTNTRKDQMTDTRLPNDLSDPDLQVALPDLEDRAEQLDAETGLSKRQAYVLLLSARGLSYDTIADIIGVSSRSTVADHYSAAKRHVRNSEALADLMQLTAVAGGEHFMYREIASRSWTPSTYDHPEVTLIELSVHQHQTTGDFIWWSQAEHHTGASQVNINTTLKHYPYAAAEGWTAHDSTLIEETFANPDHYHLVDAVGIASVLDEALETGGTCLSRVPGFYGQNYPVEEVLTVIECDIVDPLRAADFLRQPEHDREVIYEYIDENDL